MLRTILFVSLLWAICWGQNAQNSLLCDQAREDQIQKELIQCEIEAEKRLSHQALSVGFCDFAQVVLVECMKNEKECYPEQILKFRKRRKFNELMVTVEEIADEKILRRCPIIKEYRTRTELPPTAYAPTSMCNEDRVAAVTLEYNLCIDGLNNKVFKYMEENSKENAEDSVSVQDDDDGNDDEVLNNACWELKKLTKDCVPFSRLAKCYKDSGITPQDKMLRWQRLIQTWESTFPSAAASKMSLKCSIFGGKAGAKEPKNSGIAHSASGFILFAGFFAWFHQQQH